MVREHIDTVDALMAHYVAGSLPEPARVLVEAHLEMRETNRRFVSDLEALAGASLETVAPEALTNRDRRLQAIIGSAPPSRRDLPAAPRPENVLLPRAIRDFVGFEAEDIPWRTKLPGFKEHVVGHFGGCEVSFFWIRPGRAVPAHTHEGCELSIVLDGAFSDSRGRFGPGDISVADDSVDHRPVAEKERPCIGFAVVEAKLKLTGSYRQIIGDLIG